MNQEEWTALVSGSKWIVGASGILTAMMKFFDHYAAGIGAIFTILTFFTWLYFQRRADKKLTQTDKNEARIIVTEARIKELEMDILIFIIMVIVMSVIAILLDKWGKIIKL